MSPIKSASIRRRPYHHGTLRQALIDAALELAFEGSPETVSVREAARRAGVSSGAPFRHFASKAALMTAVAEQAMELFRSEIEAGQRRAPADPVSRLRALGRSFILWAFRFPVHFQIISSRHLIEFETSAALREGQNRVRDLTVELISAARNVPLQNGVDILQLALMARALVYGLARMRIDGQFPEWDIEDDHAEQTALALVDLLVSLILNLNTLPPASARPMTRR